MPLGDALLAIWEYVLAGISATIGIVSGVVWRNRKRSHRHERILEGDPKNPHAEGLLDIAADTRDRVENLETRMDEHQREVMSKLEEINGDDDIRPYPDDSRGDSEQRDSPNA